jgi:beta-glucosidase-like glycosyl hydrolase
VTDLRSIERWIGAVLAPEVRVAGTWPGLGEVVPSREYLERFPPALVVAFGRTPSGAVSPAPLVERVRAQCAELGHARPIAACDLEQGAGLHFPDATRLPPALALASAALADGGREELDWIAAAGDLTAREARARGVELVLAPVADVNTRRDNPIIAVRSFGDEPRSAGERATAWAIGLRNAGAAACAKHFPGHGDTDRDSHLELPRVARDLDGLREVELAPFRRLVAHGVDAVMVAHLDVPALTGSEGLPCTLARGAVDLLRGELGFRGAVLSDAMSMAALQGFEPRYVRALEAGCDGLLCPHDPAEAAQQLLDAARSGRIDLARLERAAETMAALRVRASEPARSGPPSPEEARGLAAELASRALRWSAPWQGSVREVRDAFPGAETPEVAALVEGLRRELAHPGGELVLFPVVCEARAGRGRYGLFAAELAELAHCLEREPRAVVAWFGSPQSLPESAWSARAPVVLANAPTPPMFAAVARALRAPASGARQGSLPARIG